MGARGRALAVDLGLAAGAVALGGVTVGPAVAPGPLAGALALVATGAGVCAGGLYLTEHHSVLAAAGAHRPLAVVVAAAATLAVGLGLVVGWTAVDSPPGALLFGAGLGLAGYRVQYGLRRPLPDRRTAQASFGRDRRR